MKTKQKSIQEQKKTSYTKLIITLYERLMISQILPKQGSKLEQMIVRSLLKRLEFSQDEISHYGIEYVKDFVKWNEAGKTATFEFDFNEIEIQILKESSKMLDEKMMINQQNLSLVEKIDAL